MCVCRTLLETDGLRHTVINPQQSHFSLIGSDSCWISTTDSPLLWLDLMGLRAFIHSVQHDCATYVQSALSLPSSGGQPWPVGQRKQAVENLNKISKNIHHVICSSLLSSTLAFIQLCPRVWDALQRVKTQSTGTSTHAVWLTCLPTTALAMTTWMSWWRNQSRSTLSWSWSGWEHAPPQRDVFY